MGVTEDVTSKTQSVSASILFNSMEDGSKGDTSPLESLFEVQQIGFIVIVVSVLGILLTLFILVACIICMIGRGSQASGSSGNTGGSPAQEQQQSAPGQSSQSSPAGESAQAGPTPGASPVAEETSAQGSGQQGQDSKTVVQSSRRIGRFTVTTSSSSLAPHPSNSPERGASESEAETEQSAGGHDETDKLL